MANTKLGFTNWVDSATLKNGTGGAAPALDETSPYTMAKVLTTDRYTLWKTAAVPAATLNLDIDLGANRAVTAIGLLGYRPSVAGIVTSVEVSSAAAAAGYVPAAWTVQATITGIVLDPRDIGAVINSVSHRYWRFTFNNAGTAAWTLGRLWLGSSTDLGAIHTPGGLYAPFRNRLETPLPGGAVVLTDLGDPGADFVHPWAQIESSLRSTLLGLNAKRGSFLLIDSGGSFFEVYLRRGRVPIGQDSHILYDINLDMARLP